MKSRDQISPSEQIRNINYITDGDTCTISWLWPRDIVSVYICRMREGEAECEVQNPDNGSKILYTREEYMEYGGYHDRSQEIGKFVYKIFPLARENGEIVLINQNDKDNCITISKGKVYINCFIKERHRLLNSKKSVKIIVYADTAVSKDALCYVKKTGSIPYSIEDGTVFPFLQDFNPGENVLPEIEIGKDEYVRLFLANSKTYGDIYELIYR